MVSGHLPFAEGEFQWDGCVTVQTRLNCYHWRTKGADPFEILLDMAGTICYNI